MAKGRPRKLHKERIQPHPDDIRDTLRRAHRTLLEIGGNWEQVPGDVQWKALKMAHEIALELRHIGNGVDGPLGPKPDPMPD